MAEGEGQSKSAKRRAAKKNREAEAAAESAPPAPAPVPAPVPKTKAAAPAPAPAAGYPEPKAKAKAQPKPEAKAKAVPKAKAEPEPKAVAKATSQPAPKASAAQAAPKAAANAKKAAKNAPKKEEVEEKVPEKEEAPVYVELDDGTGADWEVCTGLTKKQQKQKERQEEEKRLAKLAGPQAVNNKYIPGMGPAPVAQHIPGMAPQSVTAVAKNGPAAAKAAEGAAATPAKEEAPKIESFSAEIKVPEDKIGIVIGPKGAKIKLIQEKTGVTRIDTSGDVFTITGPADAVSTAENAIRDLMTKGYTALAFDDFSENFVMVHPNTMADLIGKEGKVIRAMKEQLHVEVSIPKTGPPGKKWKVTIAGKNQNVERAKEVINEIMMYYHSEVTHPDEVHEEVEVPPWAYAFIIGKGGSELRHIQKNFRVRVYIPREGVSVNENVVVVGLKTDVTRASAYIQKLLYNAQDVSKGRDRQDKADDGWGDEGPEEEWMKQYMYKRH